MGDEQCACIRVKYAQVDNPDGTCSDSWACTDCGSKFIRRAFADYLAREQLAAAEALASGRLQDLTDARKQREDLRTQLAASEARCAALEREREEALASLPMKRGRHENAAHRDLGQVYRHRTGNVEIGVVEAQKAQQILTTALADIDHLRAENERLTKERDEALAANKREHGKRRWAEDEGNGLLDERNALRAENTRLQSDYAALRSALEWAHKEASGRLPEWWHALIAQPNPGAKWREVMRKAREFIIADERVDEFDCPHDAEHRCRCGDIQSDLHDKYRNARAAAKAAIDELGVK